MNVSGPRVGVIEILEDSELLLQLEMGTAVFGGANTRPNFYTGRETSSFQIRL